MGVLSKNSGLKSLKALLTAGRQPLVLCVEEMITSFFSRFGYCIANEFRLD
jgi:hypothetical protein